MSKNCRKNICGENEVWVSSNHVPCIFNPFVWRKGREGNRMEGNGSGEEKSAKELQEFPLRR